MRENSFLLFLVGLDARHRRLAFGAFRAFPRIARQLHAKGVLQRPIPARQGDGGAPIPQSLADLQGYGAVVNRVAASRLTQASCLVRSVYLQNWLAKHAVPSELRIGVRFEEGVFAAHAWLEADGVPINDSRASIDGFEPVDDPQRLLQGKVTWR